MSTTTAVVNLPASGVWTVDSVHSSVSFSLRHHAVARFRSGFTSITGSYDADESLLTGEVKVADLDLRVEQLKSHLLSTDFFNAEAFPSFSFASNSISAAGV